MASHPVTGIPTHYEDGDEHNYSCGAIREEQKHHLHSNVKGYLRKDQKNKGMDGMISEDIQEQVNERYKNDPLYSATMHNNKPSKGAKQDAQIQAEEAEILRKKQKKGDSMPGKKLA